MIIFVKNSDYLTFNTLKFKEIYCKRWTDKNSRRSKSTWWNQDQWILKKKKDKSIFKCMNIEQPVESVEKKAEIFWRKWWYNTVNPYMHFIKSSLFFINWLWKQRTVCRIIIFFINLKQMDNPQLVLVSMLGNLVFFSLDSWFAICNFKS